MKPRSRHWAAAEALLLAGATLLGPALLTWIASALAVLVGGRVTPAAPVAALGATSLLATSWLAYAFPRWRSPAAALLAGTLILLGVTAALGASMLLGGRVLDATYDGQWIHQEAVLQLAEGWSPVEHALTPEQVEDPGLRARIEGYGNATWLAGAALYRLTGRIEHAKALNLMLMLAAGTIAAGTLLRRGRLAPWAACCTGALLATSPIAITQTLNAQLDGALGSLLLIAGALTVLAQAEPRLPYLTVLAGAAAMAACTKLTGPFFLVIILSGGLVAARWLIGVRAQRRMVLALVAAAAAAAVLGAHPWLTNTLRHHHPLYPAAGPEKIQLMVTPDQVPPLTLAASVLSRSRHAATSWDAVDRLRSWRDLKVPFTFSHDEVAIFRLPDVRIGGMGPLFSGAVLLALVLASLLAAFDRGRLRICAVLALPVLASVVALPDAWMARYVPQLWSVPLLVAAPALACRRRTIRTIAVLVLVVAAADVLLVTAGYVPATLRHSRYLKGFILDLAARREDLALNLGRFPSARERLTEHGVAFHQVDDPMALLPLYLGTPEPRIDSVQLVEAPAPTDLNGPAADGPLVEVAWPVRPEAVEYELGILLPPPAGPSGAPLTVLRRRIRTSPARVPAPSGPFRVLLAPCNRIGCGVPAVSEMIRPPTTDRDRPILGCPAPGSVIRSPTIMVTWLAPRPASKQLDQPTAHVEIVEAGSTEPAATAIVTGQSFAAVHLDRDGDWEVRLRLIAGNSTTWAEPIRFTTSGIGTPSIVSPVAGSMHPPGPLELRWTPVPGSSCYQYLIARPGSTSPVATGRVTQARTTVALDALDGAPITYHITVRACRLGSKCREASEIGWGPWSLQATTGPLSVIVDPRLTGPVASDPAGALAAESS